MKKLQILYIIALFAIVSCSLSNKNAQYKNVNEAGWKAKDTLSFEINVDDISKKYQLKLAVRHNKNYEFNNFWVRIIQKAPKEKADLKNIEIPLYNKIGKPYGKCTGSLCTQIFPIEKSIQFKHKGKYTIEVIQLMRQEPLLGIKDVGVILE